MSETDFRHEPQNDRFVASVDGGTARVEYAEAGDDTLDYTSTWVPPALRGEGLGERHDWLRGFVDAYRSLRESRPERVERLSRAVARYDRLLDAFGLTDAQVASAYPAGLVGRWTLRTLAVLIFLLPLALVGTVLSWIPYRVCGWLGSRVADDPDQPASHKIFGGLVLFPLTWVAEITVAWRWGGSAAGLPLLALALGGSWAALRFRDRWRLLREEARAWLLLRSSDRLREELRRRRREIRAELVRLVEEWGKDPIDPETPNAPS